MQISKRGLDFLTGWEGCILHAYDDADPKRRPIGEDDKVRGVLTIGYGHTKTAKPGMKITEAAARDLLRADLAPRETVIGKYVSSPLSQSEFDAALSLLFNIGEENFANSTFVREINRGRKHLAAGAMRLFDKQRIAGELVYVEGLAKRRVAESNLFRFGDYAGRP